MGLATTPAKATGLYGTIGKEVLKVLGIEIATDYVIKGVSDYIKVEKLPLNVDELVKNKQLKDTVYALILNEKILRDD